MYRFNKNLEVLSEAYFGNNENISKIVKEFDNILSITVTSKSKMNELFILTKLSSDDRYNVSQHIIKICELVKTEFGFNNVSIDIDNDNEHANACTLPQNYTDPKSFTYEIKKTSKGMKFTKNAPNLYVQLGSILFSGKFTAREITAILLHEIGHNFYINNNSSYLTLMLIEDICLTFGFVAIMRFISDIGHKSNFMIEINKMLLNSRIYNSILNITDSIKEIVSVLSYIPKQLSTASGLLAGRVKFVPNIYSPIRYADGVRNEKFSDNFASSYGFSIDLSTGLSKLKTVGLQSIPFLNTIQDIYVAPVRILQYLIDPHPSAYNRINDQIKYLKNEVSSIKNADMKKQLNQQISQLEKISKNFTQLQAADDISRGKFFSALYTTITAGLLKGSQPHNLIGKGKGNKDWKQFDDTDNIYHSKI